MTTTVRPFSLTEIREIVRPLEPTATAYLGQPEEPVGDTLEDLTLRWRALAARLTALGTPDSTVEAMGAQVGSLPSHLVAAGIIAAGDDGTIDVSCHQLPGGSWNDRADFARPAHVLPMVWWLQRHPAYVEVVIDRAGAELTGVAAGATVGTTQTIVGPDDEIVAHPPFGWDQPRWQRRAEDSWRHNAGAVAEATAAAMRAVGADLVLLAGDFRTAGFFTEQLRELAADVVIRDIPGGRHPDGSHTARRSAVRTRVDEYVDETTARLLAAFDAERGPHGRAAEGVAETLDALAAGRVRTLFVVDDETDRRTAWMGPGTLCASQVAAQLTNRGQLSAGRLLDIAVRAALLTDAQVRVVGADAGLAEHIGAWCRFPVNGRES